MEAVGVNKNEQDEQGEAHEEEEGSSWTSILHSMCNRICSSRKRHMEVAIDWMTPTTPDIHHTRHPPHQKSTTKKGHPPVVRCVDVWCGGCPILRMVWWMSSLVNVWCGGCPFFKHSAWWMSDLINVWCGGCPVWWRSGVVNVLFHSRCGGCLV